MGITSPTISSAVAGIQKAIDQLTAVEAKSTQEAEMKASKADALLQESIAANDNSAKAKKIRTNIEKLLAG